MKKLFRVLLGILFLGSAGLAAADEVRHEDHDKVRVIIVPKKRYHRRYHRRRPHHAVSLKIGIGDQHDEHHEDHR